jgi:CheY-like chemotaxis protein
MPPLVLVVEDELLIRDSAVEMLENAGYATLSAASADEAIRLLESHSDISLVFTDIEMPGSMNGLKLAAAIRDRWPPVQLIVTSGRSFSGGPEGLPPNVPFLPKPYDQAEITRHVRRLVA